MGVFALDRRRLDRRNDGCFRSDRASPQEVTGPVGQETGSPLAKGPVQVDAIITNQDCAASSGSYTVAIRVLDADNNSVEHEFEETWQRVDDQQIVTTTSYPIGKNVDLRRVRARNLSCTCVEPIIQESNEP